MKNPIYLLLVIPLLWYSCSTEKENQSSKVFSELYNSEQVQSEFFRIDADQDTVLKAKEGSCIEIKAGTFVHEDGTPVNGTLTIEFKEALDHMDMIMGNLATVSNGEMLESDGMVYLNAESDGQQLKFAAGKTAAISVPSKSKMEGMNLFASEFDETSNEINWVDPQPITDPEIISNSQYLDPADDFTFQDNMSGQLQSLEAAPLNPNEPVPPPPPAPVKPVELKNTDSRIMSIVFGDEKMFPELQHYSNVKWHVTEDCEFDPKDADNFWYSFDIEKTEIEGRYRMLLEGMKKNQKIKKVYTVVPALSGADYDDAIAKYDAKFEAYETKKAEIEAARIKQEKERARLAEIERKRQEELMKIAQERQQKQLERQAQLQQQRAQQQAQTNSFVSTQDPNTSYIFSINRIGWSNIDKFYKNPINKQVPVIANISNQEGFDQVYVTLVFKNRKIMLYGTRQANGQYYFNNSQTLPLPPTEKYIAIATTYKNGEPFIGITDFKASAAKNIQLTLKKTTKSDLKKEINKYVS